MRATQKTSCVLLLAVLVAMIGACSPTPEGSAPSSESPERASPPLVLSPRDQEMIQQLQALHAAERFAEGVKQAEAYLEQNPQAPRVHYILGVLRGSNKDHLGAIRSFEAELDLDPGHVESQLGIATAHTRLGRLEESLSYFEQVRSREPDRAEAAFQLGRNLSQLGRVDEAILELNEAWKLGHGANAAVELALIHRRRGDLDAAESACRRALVADPRNPSALLNLGQVWLRQGKTEAGEFLLERHRQESKIHDQLDQATQNSRLRSGSAYLLVERAKAERAKGQLAKARATLKRAMQVEPEFVVASMELSDLSLELGDGETSRRSALSALMRGGKDPRLVAGARFLLGLNRIASGQPEQAESMLAQASAAAWRPEARLRLARAWLDVKELGRARDEFAWAVENLADDPRGYLGLAKVALREGRQADAASRLERAIELDSTSLEGWLLLALATESIAAAEEQKGPSARALELGSWQFFSREQAQEATTFLESYPSGSTFRQSFLDQLDL